MVDILVGAPKAWEGGAFLHFSSLQRMVNHELGHLEDQLWKAGWKEDDWFPFTRHLACAVHVTPCIPALQYTLLFVHLPRPCLIHFLYKPQIDGPSCETEFCRDFLRQGLLCWSPTAKSVHFGRSISHFFLIAWLEQLKEGKVSLGSMKSSRGNGTSSAKACW